MYYVVQYMRISNFSLNGKGSCVIFLNATNVPACEILKFHVCLRINVFGLRSRELFNRKTYLKTNECMELLKLARSHS